MTPRPGRALARAVRAGRFPLFLAGAGLSVLGIMAVAVRVGVDPRSPRAQYGLHAAALLVAAVSVAAVWHARRRQQLWDADLLPALFGGLAALTLLASLHGTPFGEFGLQGDASFRTEAITRFADSWGGDYTYRGLPAYYAPGFFWILGRFAALTGAEPWHMMKFGEIAVAFLAPAASYLAWRLIVPVRAAALIAAVPLVVPDLSESYGWIVQVVIIPWWLAAIHGLARPGVRRPNIVALGLVGGLLFCVYYYYFFVFVLVYGLMLVVSRRRGELNRGDVLRGLVVLGVAAAVSAIYWAPLAWNFLTAPAFESLNNRWLTVNSGDLALPMLEPSVVGALCLIGLVFLAVTAGEMLSRSLLIVVSSLYLWHGIGYLALVVGVPLMSFRMKALVPVVLLSAAVLALLRVAKYLAGMRPAAEIWRLVAIGAALLAAFAGDRFVTIVVDDPRVRAAHDETRPDGRLPAFHSADAKAKQPSAEVLKQTIDAGYHGAGRPVVLSDRTDLFAFYPYFGFVQWNANYSHPTSRYHERLAFLDDVSRVNTAEEFADRTADNPYDRIDALVLRMDGDSLVYRTYDDDFPFGTKARTVVFPIRLVQPEYFTITRRAGYLVAVRIR